MLAEGFRTLKRGAHIVAALACPLALGACGHARPAPRAPTRLPVAVLSDTVASYRLMVAPAPPARVWLERTSLERAPVPATPIAPEPAAERLAPRPAAAPDSIPPAPPAAPDDALRPPLLRSAAPLVGPIGAPHGSVELDVRVDEAGRVTDARPASGPADARWIAAARGCALAMRFYPALRGGRPVAVWCRQRFEFGAR